MTASVPAAKSRILSARRLVLLAGVAGLGATVLLGGAGFMSNATGPNLTSIAYAQNSQRPVGFADIVEKVKPAVISVRVKVDSGAKMMGLEGSPFPPNSQMERFFRRFGMPDGANPDEPRTPRNRFVTGQGSGFFISADGYAVTNNHVVDKADTVQITADDGKTYTAKVIGTDPRTDIALLKADGRSETSHQCKEELKWEHDVNGLPIAEHCLIVQWNFDVAPDISAEDGPPAAETRGN